jgi:hypothetical protein
MNSMKYFNKEINLAKKDNDLPRFNKAWEDLETWRDGTVYHEMMALLHSADEIVYAKKKKEYDDAWALGMKCLDYMIDRATNGLEIE